MSTQHNDLTPHTGATLATPAATDGDDFLPNPGLEEHVERYTDADEAAGNRAARSIVMLFGGLVPLLSILFLVIYFAVPRHATINVGFATVNAQHIGLGVTLGLALASIGVGLVHWAKQIMNDHEMVEERHPIASDEATRESFLADVEAGKADSGVGRRPLLLAALGGGVGMVLLPAIVTLADMGPWPVASKRKDTIMKTLWAEGVHLVNDVTYARIKASDMEIGQLINAEPENLKELHHSDPVRFQQEKAKAALVIVRMDPADIKIPESRKDWQVSGILAYSKICTHVGCPISLWEQQTHHLLCPCHQSTFDLGDSGLVVFGPAARALPQLPISVDEQGYLVARSDFTVPVGPSFFERDSRSDYKKGDQ